MFPPILFRGKTNGEPEGSRSAHYHISTAVSTNNHQAVAALFRHAMGEPERARGLHKARSILDAGAAALACLRGWLLEHGEAPPRLELTTPQQQQHEKLHTTAAFAVEVSGRRTAGRARSCTRSC